METEFKILTFAGEFVDEKNLTNGIYSTIKPTLHHSDLTKDQMVKDAQRVYKYAPSLRPRMEKYIDNLLECKLEIFTLKKITP